MRGCTAKVSVWDDMFLKVLMIIESVPIMATNDYFKSLIKSFSVDN